MKKLLIVANWKSNKNIEEAMQWMYEIHHASFGQSEIENKEIILCPPLLLLPGLKSLVDTYKDSPFTIKLGSQDMSPFDAGAYTGEEPPHLLKEFAEYAIIGHSERRTHFFENDDMLTQKVNEAFHYFITPLFCIQNEDTFIPKGVKICAYEPPSAIGTGRPDTPENANNVADTVKKSHHVEAVLYGGSVKPENVKNFTQMEHIDGVLIGGASLDPFTFIQIIKNS